MGEYRKTRDHVRRHTCAKEAPKNAPVGTPLPPIKNKNWMWLVSASPGLFLEKLLLVEVGLF